MWFVISVTTSDETRGSYAKIITTSTWSPTVSDKNPAGLKYLQTEEDQMKILLVYQACQDPGLSGLSGNIRL